MLQAACTCTPAGFDRNTNPVLLAASQSSHTLPKHNAYHAVKTCWSACGKPYAQHDDGLVVLACNSHSKILPDCLCASAALRRKVVYIWQALTRAMVCSVSTAWLIGLCLSSSRFTQLLTLSPPSMKGAYRPPIKSAINCSDDASEPYKHTRPHALECTTPHSPTPNQVPLVLTTGSAEAF